MKLKCVLTVWLFLGIFMAISLSGMAQWRRPGPWSSPGLNLTEEQLAGIQEVRLGFQEKIMPLRLKWQKAQVNLDSLEMKGADQKELEAAYKALDGFDIEIEKAYQDHWNEMRNLLNEEQQVLFDRYGGLGMGLGWGRGMNPRWGMRPGWGRGFGPGYGLGMRQGYRFGWDSGMGPWFSGRGRGMGRGYFCPWLRWR
jgi:hypothetical protein